MIHLATGQYALEANLCMAGLVCYVVGIALYLIGKVLGK